MTEKQEKQAERILTPNEIELIGLDALMQRYQSAQAAMVAGLNACAALHGMEPPKIRYEPTADGKALRLIDAE